MVLYDILVVTFVLMLPVLNTYSYSIGNVRVDGNCYATFILIKDKSVDVVELNNKNPQY